MASDRSWMSPRFNSDGTLRAEFIEGVKEFIAVATANSLTDGSGGEIKCPCTHCHNKWFMSVDKVTEHIYRLGFTKNYTLWKYHGECNGSSSSGMSDVEAAIENRSPEARSETSDPEAACENRNPIVQMVFDGVGPDLNDNEVEMDPAECNEDMCSHFDAAKFESLLRDANTPLYNGCEEFSVLEVVSEMLNQKSEGQTSVRVFDEQIKLLKKVLPADNKLPKNFYECKKKLRKLGLGYQKIHSCKNNCMLFYKENEHLTECTFCGMSRYKVLPSKGKKGIPNSVLRYLPITPRLQRLYMSAKTAPDMTWHARNRSEDGTMAHPSDSEAWKHFSRRHEEFASDPRNVRLGLCTDGFTPFDHYGAPFSCWPVILTVYNLPPWMCMKEPYMFLNMIIPGPGHPGRDIDVFLKPLIDELQMLWTTGVRAFDAARREHFRMRAALLWTISDLPAYAMLSGWSTQGKMACPYCMENGNAIWLDHGRKCSHFDCHRKFLPSGHPFRENVDDFRKGVEVEQSPPPILNGDELFERVSLLQDIPFGKQHKDKKIDGFGVSHHWKKKSVFWDLPYWRTLLIRHNLDVMHAEKNVFENLFNTVMDVKFKTKDNQNAREDMAILCNRPRLELRLGRNGKIEIPPAPFALDADQQIKVYRWLKELKLPDGYGSNISRCVSADDKKCTGLKSHDCHVMLQVLLPIALRDMLPKEIWEVITELSTFFKDICSRVVNVARVKQLREQIVVTLCKLEKHFIPSFFDISEHLLVHLPYEAEIGGPVQYRWMYPFERFLNGLKRKVKNKAHVEASICEAYIVQETTTFCSMYFGVEVMSRVHRPPRNDDGGAVGDESKLSTFRHPIRLFARDSGLLVDVSQRLLHLAHTYILGNTPEITPYLRKFEDLIVSKYPRVSAEELDKRRLAIFAPWFREYVCLPGSAEIDERIRELGLGPKRFVKRYNGCFTNGFTFHTAKRGCLRSTANTGVSIKGESIDGLDSYYYGLLQEIWEMEYSGGCGSIILFRCHWYDSIGHVRVHRSSGLVELDPTSRYPIYEPFVLASQALQVCYATYPGGARERRGWWAVIKGKSVSTYNYGADAQGYNGTFQADEMEGGIFGDPNVLPEDRLPGSPVEAQEVYADNAGVPCSGISDGQLIQGVFSPASRTDGGQLNSVSDNETDELEQYTDDDDDDDDPDYS